MHTFNATGLTYFFKTLDNYGNQLQDPNYTTNVMHTIVENRNYEMLREDLKSIISSIPINNLNQVYQIYKRYSELTEEKILSPKQGEPHFDIQKYYGIKQVYLTTFAKHKEQYFDKMSRQIGVINNTLNGNFSNITSDNNSRTLLSILGPDEIQKALIQNLVIEVKNEDPYIVPDLNHLENTLPEYTLTRFANDLTEEKFPYDLSSLNTLNEITKKTYINEYNYPNQNVRAR